MKELHVYIREKATGFYLGELDASTTNQSAIDAFWANLPADREALDKATNPRPPDRPAVPDPQQPKRDRLAALRAKGWTSLTVTEQAEARALAFDLGEWAPA